MKDKLWGPSKEQGKRNPEVRRYTIRRPGCVEWVTFERRHMDSVYYELCYANTVVPGHKVYLHQRGCHSHGCSCKLKDVTHKVVTEGGAG